MKFKLSYAKKILVGAIIAFVAIIILDAIFTSMLLNKIYSINDKVKQLDISSREREKDLALKDSIASSEEERSKLAEYFVGKGDAEAVKFTEYLEILAAENKVTQRKTLNYEPVADLSTSDVVSAIRYRFNISGSWGNVYNFLQAIENLPKVSYVNNAALSYDGKLWTADLDFSVIKLK